jgi:CubicO group peptidase (beta-lactamase class C family)
LRHAQAPPHESGGAKALPTSKELEHVRLEIHSYANLRLRDSDLAEDVAQDALARCLTVIRTRGLPVDCTLGSYVTGIARHIVLDLFRRGDREVPLCAADVVQRDRSAPHSLAQATINAMLAAHETADGRSSINRAGVATGIARYGLGWRIDRTPDGDRFYHSGSNSTGFQCYAEFDPATGNGIVIMTNSSSGSPLWRAARAAIDF